MMILVFVSLWAGSHVLRQEHSSRDASASEASWLKKWEPAQKALFSKYNAFILIGEKWQVLLIWPKPAAFIKHKHGLASEKPSMAFKLEAFRNLPIEANYLVDLKHGQEKAVDCLSEGMFLQLCQLDVVNILYFNYLQLQWWSRKFTKSDIPIL